jgi:uncharacterized protein (DUF2235 family)
VARQIVVEDNPGLAFGTGLTTDVLEGYAYLMQQLAPNDHVFIAGPASVIDWLQRAVENFFVDSQVISPRRTKSIEDARRRERFHTMRNIARQIERIAR